MKNICIDFLDALGISIGAISHTERLDTGLKKILRRTAERFEKKNHVYIINLIIHHGVEFQINHGALVQQTATEFNEFNFSLNIPFESKKKEQAFKKLSFANEFKYYEFQELPNYALNLGNDQEKAYQIVFEILKEVYGFKNSTVIEFETHDQGRIIYN
ncbi:hypothetical protein [Urechidicola croceus]|uniref:Uncharacterized protein n=1 Tax=Urechidicola croceus TaxID=1850246 RepID=A0A1D8P446_9FLAO|nr:hypothetical protein [Urechidicola croceus]AOW19364.1 hypothetical protein LPB138_01100 [Urechidicola croceus]AOW20739.1 hypothetical protein LPB138_08645 [Urechidicola croceus]